MSTMRREKKRNKKKREGERAKEAVCTGLMCAPICMKILCQNSNQVLHHVSLPVLCQTDSNLQRQC